MNPKEFEKIRDRRVKKMVEVSEEKRRVYATPDDEFYNLRRSAKITNTDIATTWKVKMAKQLTTVLDMLEGRITPTQELIDEKLGDVCVYMIIAEGILREKMALINENTAIRYKAGSLSTKKPPADEWPKAPPMKLLISNLPDTRA